MGFEKHWNEWVIASNCTKEEAQIHFEAGAASQQGEVENSYKIGYQEGFNSRESELRELQKRIDDALDMLERRKGKVLLGDIVDALKGQNNG